MAKAKSPQSRRGFRNEGTEDFEKVNLRLFYNDQLASTAQIDVSANGTQEYTFEIDPKANGLNKVKITLEDPKVLFDNDFNLTLNNIEKVTVHEVRGSKSSPYVKQLFDENELFNYESFDINNLDNAQLVLADIIILNQLSNLSNQLIASLNNVLEMNGTVLIIPSEEGAARIYDELGLSVRGDSEEKLELAQPNFQNPFFDGIFEEKNEAISMPDASNKFRLMNSELAVLSFKNGRDFLSKAATTKGNVYFFSTDFGDNATGFPSHSLFVPIMYKLALGSKVNLSRPYYLTDEQTIVYPLDVALSANDILTLENGEKKITPDQRISGKSLILEVPKDELSAGGYQLKAGNQEIGTLAFNASKSESSVLRYSSDELAEIAQAPHIYVISASEAIDVDRELTSGVKGIELWKYALMLSLFFLFAEIILIRYL
uniref:hypothetical protein n=1 Tax=Roseivirga sp. TaxID=1964215 RepID=UPI00404734AB